MIPGYQGAVTLRSHGEILRVSPSGLSRVLGSRKWSADRGAVSFDIASKDVVATGDEFKSRWAASAPTAGRASHLSGGTPFGFGVAEYTGLTVGSAKQEQGPVPDDTGPYSLFAVTLLKSLSAQALRRHHISHDPMRTTRCGYGAGSPPEDIRCLTLSTPAAVTWRTWDDSGQRPLSAARRHREPV